MTAPNETSSKSLLFIVVPIIITGLMGILDNAFRWRTEMEQKQFDRQTRILDKIMEIGDPVQRAVVTQFYLDTGLFTGGFRNELEVSLKSAQDHLTQVSDHGEVVPEPIVEYSPPEDSSDTGAVDPNAGYSANDYIEPSSPEPPFPHRIEFDIETIRKRIEEQRNFHNKTIFSFDEPVRQLR